jgi:hypothetical protein
MCWSFLPRVRFLILLTVFELLPKTCNFTICSIFSNSGHVGWCTASPDTILKLDTLVMIQTKFGFHWSSTLGEKIFEKVYDVRRRRTPSDGNSRWAKNVLLGWWRVWEFVGFDKEFDWCLGGDKSQIMFVLCQGDGVKFFLGSGGWRRVGGFLLSN